MAASRITPFALAAALALEWLAVGPATPDLAAQVYRTGLFEREGMTIFDLSWYGGHHMPGYSLLFPPLAAMLGVRVIGALAAVVSALLFERIARRHFGDTARWGALWFGAGTTADLLIGRLTFALGVTIALAAVLALQHGRRRLGLALGVAFAGPLLVCAALSGTVPAQRRRAFVAVLVGLLVWQWWAPVRETIKGAVDPSARQAYFGPLLAFLEDRAEAAPVRVEVPFTRLHWEAVHVARRTSLARGWQTQLDVKYNALFRARNASRLTPERYHAWLRREGVHYVALPDVALDPTGRAEAALVRRGLPFLRPVFFDRHWEVFEVLGTPGLTDGVGRLTRIGAQSFTLVARRPGTTRVRVRHTPYWRIERGNGCVSRAAGGWTTVRAARAGTIVVGAVFDPRRILSGAPRCSRPGARLDGGL